MAVEDYKKPIDKAVAAPLAPPALSAFRALFWPGVVLAVVGVIGWIVAFNAEDAYESVGGASGSNSALVLSAIFLAASGVVSGLGKREAPPAL